MKPTGYTQAQERARNATDNAVAALTAARDTILDVERENHRLRTALTDLVLNTEDILSGREDDTRHAWESAARARNALRSS